MDILMIFIVCTILGAFSAVQHNNMKKLRRELTTQTPPVAITDGVQKPHTLVKTWMEAHPTDNAWEGWRWKCSCGVQGIANNLNKISLGTESSAIDQFEKHVSGYARANKDVYREKYEELLKRYEESQRKCICKDI